MSFRTPNISGLAVPPNATGDADNPAASPVELAVHHFWGRYQTSDDLPNAGGNAATGPAYAALRPGDIAFVQSVLRTYELLSRGTDGGADAIWIAMGGGTDRFAPTIVVGNTLAGDPAVAAPAPFQYIPDPGDGTGIAAALAAVPAAGGWVHVRRGTYTLAAGVLPLPLPPSCRVTGDGASATILVARADDRRVFAVGGAGADSDIELSSIGFTLPAAAAGATGLTMIDGAFGQRVRFINLRVQGPGVGPSPDESLTSIIRVGGDSITQQCHLAAIPSTTNGGQLACIRLPGFAVNARVVDNFAQGGDYEILADGTSGAATGLRILNNYCLGNANVAACIVLTAGGSRQFVRGNLCVSGDIGILYAANGGHVTENQCYQQVSNPIVLNGGAVVCIGNTISSGAAILDQGMENVVAHNASF